MFFIAYAFKGQVHVFAGRVKTVIHSSCRTSAILKYFCPLASMQRVNFVVFLLQASYNGIISVREDVTISSVKAAGPQTGLLQDRARRLGPS